MNGAGRHLNGQVQIVEGQGLVTAPLGFSGLLSELRAGGLVALL